MRLQPIPRVSFVSTVILRQFLIIGDGHAFTASSKKFRWNVKFLCAITRYFFFFFRLLIIRQVDAREKGEGRVERMYVAWMFYDVIVNFFISYHILFFRLFFRLLLICRRNPLHTYRLSASFLPRPIRIYFILFFIIFNLDKYLFIFFVIRDFS